MSLVPYPKDCSPSVRMAIQKLASIKMGPKSTPTFAGLTLTGLTANSLIYPTSAGLLTSIGEATNGQLPIGSTNATPVLATITETANQVLVANDAGTITLSTPQDIAITSSPTFAGLNLGTGELTCGSINRAAGTLTIEIGGAAEVSITSTTTTFGGNLIIPDTGYIGSVSDTDAIRVNTTGIVISQNLNVSGWADIAGCAAIGPNAVYTPNTCALVTKNFTINDNVLKRAIKGRATGAKTTAAFTSHLAGVKGEVFLDDANDQNWTNSVGLRGLEADVETDSSCTGIITGAAGLFVEANFQDSVTVTNYYGVKVQTPTVDNNKLTNAYGIYLNTINTALTLNYAIYTNSGLVRLGDAITGTSTAVFEGASVTVGKANTTTGTIVLHDSNSANTITLTVPDISAGSLTFTLPPTDGDNTNVLQTDGNGVLTWVAAGGGDEKVKIDAAATAGYIGVASNDGVLRTDTGLSYTDGGDFVTLEATGLLGDGTVGRVFRIAYININDGTNADTLECEVISVWNGDADGPTDNVAKGATTGNYTLTASGKGLTIEAAALSGSPQAVFANLNYNASGTSIFPTAIITGGDIEVSARAHAGGAQQDWCALANIGLVRVYLLYITDA